MKSPAVWLFGWNGWFGGRVTAHAVYFRINFVKIYLFGTPTACTVLSSSWLKGVSVEPRNMLSLAGWSWWPPEHGRTVTLVASKVDKTKPTDLLP